MSARLIVRRLTVPRLYVRTPSFWAHRSPSSKLGDGRFVRFCTTLQLWRDWELWGLGQVFKSSPPSPFRTLSPYAPSLPLPYLSLSLHVPPFPPYSQPFPSLSLSPLPVIASSGFGERYSSPAGPGRARPSNEFLCNLQPNICKSVKSFTHVHKTHIHFRKLGALQ